MSTAGRRPGTLKDKSVTVLLLDKSRLTIPIKHKTRYGDILIKLRKHLNLSSSNVFGLAYKTDNGDFRFLDPLWKVWKLERITSQNCQSPETTCHIYLRVQYYVETGHHFRSESDKRYYYLQLKENFLRYGFNYPDDRCFLLASYAIHADAINWREFDPRQYFPAWILKSYGTQFVRKHMPTIKPDKLSPSQAMVTYINELSSPSPYIYNMRLYRLQICKHITYSNIRLGVCQQGLEIYEVDASGYLNFLSSCSWQQIQSVHYFKRKIVISANGKNLEFYTHADEWCRELCNVIKSSQCVYMGLQDGSAAWEDQQTELGATSFREAYIYSNEQDLEWEYEQGVMGTLTHQSNTCPPSASTNNWLPKDGSECDLTIPYRSRSSIVSTTSSTTTSGIVSDRTCLSTGVSQEDLISSTTRPSSCDSLLSDPEYCSSYSTRPATVQRAISEPSKKFEHLRSRVIRSPKGLPRRALSDETIDEHDYENIAIIRKALGMNPVPVKKIQTSFHGQTAHSLMLTNRSPAYLPPSRSMIHTSSSMQPLLSLSQSGSTDMRPYHYASVSSPSSSSQHRYSLISNSPSMEKLLLDYTPPPSYNENHARQRQQVLAASRQASDDSTNSVSPALTLSSPVKSSTPILGKSSRAIPDNAQRKVWSAETEPSIPAKKQNSNCRCLHLSHPEIDKLRNEVKNDVISLPMISALCNDRELIKSTKQCTCDLTGPSSPRPTSWHCDSNPVFRFPASVSSAAQACH